MPVYNCEKFRMARHPSQVPDKDLASCQIMAEVSQTINGILGVRSVKNIEGGINRAPVILHSSNMASGNRSSAPQLQELRKLLARLPPSLPEPSAATTHYPFVGFEPDLEFLECMSGDKIIPILK